MDELVAATLLRYPIYWGLTLTGSTSCEVALMHLTIERDRLSDQDGGAPMRMNYARRQTRKLMILGRAWAAA